MSSLNSEEEEAGLYIVDEVLDHKFEKGKMQLLVSWHGYPSDENSWEPEEDVRKMAQEAVDAYWLTVDMSEDQDVSDSDSSDLE